MTQFGNARMASRRPAIQIQPIDSLVDMKALEKLQQDVWGWSDLDTTPLMIFIVMKEVGGSLIGAFDGQTLVGFAFGVIGYDEGRTVFHSHMLAVHPTYHDRGLGERLKLAQRMTALERGFDRITWTFDPLQSKNAHLNFRKLGVVANRYKINCYGEYSSSALYRHIGTDRLWVEWFLNSPRVRNRVEARHRRSFAYGDRAERLVQIGRDGSAIRHAVDLHARTPLSIEIPASIHLLQQERPESAVAWRHATRAAFVDAFAAGYRIDDYRCDRRNGLHSGCYLLTSGTVNDPD